VLIPLVRGDLLVVRYPFTFYVPDDFVLRRFDIGDFLIVIGELTILNGVNFFVPNVMLTKHGMVHIPYNTIHDGHISEVIL
jgi:hypothetical protein